MSIDADNGSDSELAFVRTYMALTGASESMARGVFMHVGCSEGEKRCLEGGTDVDTLKWEERPGIIRPAAVEYQGLFTGVALSPQG